MSVMRLLKSRWTIGVSCVLLGAAVILGIRFFDYKPEKIHYHANFAVYINGQREQFKGSQYYSETEMCAANTALTPNERAHMHDNVNNVVHVEDHAVTWGQFFANLGWSLGPNFIQTADQTMYVAHDDQQLHVLLNGQDYTGLDNMANMVIKDHDRLLLSFGSDSKATLMRQFNAIPQTARHYDVTPDPESCSGGSDSITVRERLHHLF